MITTQLIGRLGGGVETTETQITKNVIMDPPNGWQKALGVFTGKPSSTAPRLFGDRIQTSTTLPKINGGGIVQKGTPTWFENVTGTVTWIRLE